MKKSGIYILIVFFALVAFYNPASDVKIGHIDSEYVFKNIPAYQDALAEIEQYAEQYRKEVEAKYKVVDSLYKQYQKDEVFLPQETKIKRQNQIIDKENEAKELQKKYFGQGGLLDQKREELLKPIQDNVHNALKKIAEDGGFDYIFDKTTGEILYSNDNLDQSEALLKAMNIK